MHATLPPTAAKRHPRGGSLELPDAHVASQDIHGELEVIAAPHEHAEGPVALPGVHRRLREAATQQLERRLTLIVRAPFADRRRDVLTIDPERPQPALDPLRAPAVEVPAVLGEAARV